MPVINTHQNIAAFLDMLAVSEGTANHPLTKNRGYDVIVTGLDGKPEIFTDYSDHPFAHGRPAKVFNRRGEKSTASGRYQQLYLFWPHYRKQLALPDFSPLSQDRLAIQLIRERGALDDIRAGRIERAISRCRNIWASLPVTVSVSIHWKNWSPSGVPLAAYRLKRSKHHEEIIPFTDAERVAGADAGTVPDLPAERGRQFCRRLGDSGDVYLAGRCRVDFYRADLSCGVAVFPADT